MGKTALVTGGAGGIGAPDYERIARAVERRFGKPALFLYREHHMGQTPLQGESVADVSRYPDMQDLLLRFGQLQCLAVYGKLHVFKIKTVDFIRKDLFRLNHCVFSQLRIDPRF